MKKILVITDNKYLLSKFKEIVSEINFDNATFDYACSPKSIESFQEKAEVIPISVNVDYRNIINNYNLVFSLHCKQIFPINMVKNIRCVNIHPGLNPYNRGWYPQVFSIINKLPIGATIHEIDAELDHGAIIAQQVVPLYVWDTSKTIYERVLEEEIKLIQENLYKIVQHTYIPSSPVCEGNVNMKNDFTKLCELDLEENMTMGIAIDRLRALTHSPYSNAFFYSPEGHKINVSVNLSIKDGN